MGLYKKELEIDNKRTVAENENAVRKAELDVELQKKKMELRAGKDTYENDISIAKEADIKNLQAVQFDSRKVDVGNDLALDKMKFNQN